MGIGGNCLRDAQLLRPSITFRANVSRFKLFLLPRGPYTISKYCHGYTATVASNALECNAHGSAFTWLVADVMCGKVSIGVCLSYNLCKENRQ